jgi:lipid-A-disaccharide synthase-like uncharacterized protein
MVEARPGSLAGVFFVSTATLCFEVTLSRYFSISQNYHFAFLVISLAFLGYGASGTFLALAERRFRMDGESWLSFFSLLLALSILLSFWLANSIPFDFYRLPWNRKQLFLLIPYYTVLGLPFFFAGATVSFFISRAASAVHKIYFADLLGAGAGSFAAAFVFLPCGEKGVFVLISGTALAGCILFSRRRRPVFKLVLILLFLTEAGLFLALPGWLSFRISPFKALPQALRYPGAERRLTRWDAASRVDIVASPAVRFAPGLSLLYSGRLPQQLGLSVDGGELSAVTDFRNGPESGWDFVSFLPGSLPYFLLSRPRVLILEPRGGLDVQTAALFRSSRVRAIERYPLITGLLKHDLASFWGDLARRHDIELTSAEPRAAMMRTREVYDLIIISLTDVFGASGTGLHGVGENYLFTVESFVELLDRLSPDGLAASTHYLLPPPRNEARILATWIDALERRKLAAGPRIVAIRSWGTISFLIKKTPFESEEISRLKKFCHERYFDTVYYPGIPDEEKNVFNQMDPPVYEEMVAQLLSPASRRQYLNGYIFDVRAATDDRPFFSDFFKWKAVGTTYAALGRNAAIFFQGKFLLGGLFVQAVLVAGMLILLPLWIFRRKKTSSRGVLPRVFFYFSLIGAGFILIEIALIQKFILFLGQPLYSLSTVIFALLFSSALGSLFSRKFLEKAGPGGLRGILILCAVLAALYMIFLQPLLDLLIGLALGIKIGWAFALIWPLGFLMGIPFPGAIRWLQPRGRSLIAWAWSANSFSTVVHSVLAQMIAFSGGYRAVWSLAALAYLSALAFLRFADHRHKADP